MPPLDTQRWELFCLGVVAGKPNYQAAIDAGYSPRAARQMSSRLRTKMNIITRIQELQEAAASAKVMTVQERKERLSEIARAKYPDFATAGPDGSWISIGPETPNAGAIAEVRSKTEYDDDGDKPAVILSVKLHDPIRAINELNKMEGKHAPVKSEVLLPDLANLTDDQLEKIARGRLGKKA
jgi:hypothetical protein